MIKKHLYTKADEGFIFKNFPEMSDDKFAKLFGVTKKAFQQKRRKLGLIGRENSGVFKKGQKPIFINNKANKGGFKKGQTPHNTKPIGFERISKDGYLEIKTETGFKLKHRYLYEKYKGIIPKGYIVIFKDSNKRNFDLENLECISKKENLKRNRNIEKQVDSIKKTWDFAKKMKQKNVNVLWFKNKNYDGKTIHLNRNSI